MIGSPKEPLGFLKISGSLLQTKQQTKDHKKRIVKLIKGCNGHGLIRVDEAQKMGVGFLLKLNGN